MRLTVGVVLLLLAYELSAQQVVAPLRQNPPTVLTEALPVGADQASLLAWGQELLTQRAALMERRAIAVIGTRRRTGATRLLLVGCVAALAVPLLAGMHQQGRLGFAIVGGFLGALSAVIALEEGPLGAIDAQIARNDLDLAALRRVVPSQDIGGK